MRKLVNCISSIQRIMETEKVSAEVARELQEERAYLEIDSAHTNGWELEAVSGSPEQGLVLMFKDMDA